MGRLLSALCLCLLLSSRVAAAQAAPSKYKDAEGFEPVASDMMQQGETIPGARLVAAAYGFIFAAVTVWVGSVAARARRVEEELIDLRKKIEAKGA